MSRQEVYAWASVWSSLAVTLFYVLTMFGIPGVFEPIKDNIIEVVIVLVFVDLVAQTIITLQQSKSLRIEKDERDLQIEAQGFRVGYYFFVGAIALLMGHVFTMHAIESFADPEFLASMRFVVMHYLVFALVAGTTAKPIVQIIHYRRGA